MIRPLAPAAVLAAAATVALLPGAAVAAPVLPVAKPAPLRAAVAPAAPAPFASLTFTVTSGEAARRSAPVTLTCRPTGGTHPSAAKACAALEKSGGRVFGLPPRKGVLCTADYRPVTASATGHWGKRKIAESRTFSNACHLGIAAGAVFAARV